MVVINKRRNRFWWFVILSLVLIGLVYIASSPLAIDNIESQPARLASPPQATRDATAIGESAIPRSSDPTANSIKPVTALRAKLWDTKDVMASVRAVRVNGTADEKGWAADLLRECYGFVDQTRPEQYDNPSQREAWDELAKRCGGVKSTPMGERRTIVEELYAGAKGSTSTLHDLRQIYERQRQIGDNRWTNVEEGAITSALHGEDPLIRREAFNLILEAIDNKAPGGNGRREALLFAMADAMLNQPLSEFERLEHCAMLPNCVPSADGYAISPAGTPDEREGARLRAAYAEAFAKRLDASAILTIR